MSKTTLSFHFEHILLNVDHSRINVFQHVKEAFSLEYAFFDLKSVHINMCPLEREWFRKKGLDKAIATKA